MNLRRKIGALVCATGLLVAAPAMAANLAYFNSPIDTIQAAVNSVISAVNAGVGGILYSNVTAFSTGTGTSEQTAFSYTMPAGTIAIGQSLRVTCQGTTGATANNKTRTIYFGAESMATATEAANAQPWILRMLVTRTGTAAWTVQSDGLAGTGGITVLNKVQSGTDADTGIVIKCTATDGTSAAGDVVANMMLVEAVR